MKHRRVNRTIVDKDKDAKNTDLVEWARAEKRFRCPFDMGPIERGRLQLEKEEYQEKIKELEDRIGEMRDSIREFKTEITKRDALTAPIRRLPPELLSYIFCLLPTFTFPTDINTMFNLMTVCRSWYSFVRSTSALWCTVQLQRCSSLRVKSFSSWMLNARGHPLDVNLDLIRIPHGVIKYMMKHVSQWQYMKLSADKQNDRINDFFRLFPRATNLVDLRLSGDYGFSGPGDEENKDDKILELPRLHILRLHNWNLPLNFRLPALQKIRSEGVRWGYVKLDKLRGIAPNLRDLHIHQGYCRTNLRPSDFCALPFANLQNCHFSGDGVPNTEKQAFLQVMADSPDVSQIEIAMSLLPKFPYRLPPKLKSLQLFINEPKEHQMDELPPNTIVRAWWNTMKDLEKVTLCLDVRAPEHVERATTILEALSIDDEDTNPAPCPKLRELVIRLPSAQREFWRTPVLEFSRSRTLYHNLEVEQSDDEFENDPDPDSGEGSNDKELTQQEGSSNNNATSNDKGKGKEKEKEKEEEEEEEEPPCTVSVYTSCYFNYNVNSEGRPLFVRASYKTIRKHIKMLPQPSRSESPFGFAHGYGF